MNHLKTNFVQKIAALRPAISTSVLGSLTASTGGMEMPSNDQGLGAGS